MMHAYFRSLTSYFLNAHIITPLAYEESFSIIKRLKNAARCKEDFNVYQKIREDLNGAPKGYSY